MSTEQAMGSLPAERLDELYSQLCATMTELGEAQAPLYLAIVRIGDDAVIRRMLADAAEGLRAPADG
ncbi:MAG TPA: hypothetical protein PKA20_07440 [Burkholderiaceae bacterium]|nr:hypothetical protein [Burkholderiaceae bacterium]